MSAYDDNLLAARFAALAPEPLGEDWNDVLGRAGARKGRRLGGLRGRQGSRRRLIVVLAAVMLVAAVAASALAVRELLVGPGFIGVPPVGAVPSIPANGKLVLSYFGPGPEGSHGKRRIWVYDDGRLIWIQDGRFPNGANAASTGFLEQRLTPEGVQLLRSETVSTGHFGDEPPPPAPPPPCPKGVRPGVDGCVPPSAPPPADEPLVVPFYMTIEVPGLGRLVRVDRASDLNRLVARLNTPESWLPASAWAERESRAYVPTTFSVCYGHWPPDQAEPKAILDVLPARAGDMLRGRDTARVRGLFGSPGHFRVVFDNCSTVTTREARTLAKTFDEAGLERFMPRVRLAYRFETPSPGRKLAQIYFEPYLPHGEITCSACG